MRSTDDRCTLAIKKGRAHTFVMFSVLLLALGAFGGAGLPPCSEKAALCRSAAPSAHDAAKLLGAKRDAWSVRGDLLTVVTRRPEPAKLCCAIQAGLQPLGNGLQGLTVRVPGIDTAIFEIRILPGELENNPPVWRGKFAPTAPPDSSVTVAQMKRHTITSAYLGAKRDIFVWLPSGTTGDRNLPVIYLADGPSTSFASVADFLIKQGMIAPIAIVGITSGETASDTSCAPRCDPRSQEYLIEIPNATPSESRFDEHDQFVMKEVIPFVEKRYPVSRSPNGRTVAGFSSGAAWALAMAARNPSGFRNVLGLSLGWLPAVEAARNLGGKHVFLGAGTLEPRFHERTSMAAGLARSAGAEVCRRILNAGHSAEMWNLLFSEALQWFYPSGPQYHSKRCPRLSSELSIPA